MPGWGWALVGGLGALLAVGGVLVVYYARRSRRPVLDAEALRESSRRKANDELAAARTAKVGYDRATAKAEAAVAKIDADLDEQVEVIDETKDRDRGDLSRDPDALLDRVAEIVGGAESK